MKGIGTMVVLALSGAGWAVAHKALAPLLVPAARAQALAPMGAPPPSAAAGQNPWAPHAAAPPASPVPRPRYYQAPPSALSAPSARPRYAPPDLDQRLSSGAAIGPYGPGYGAALPSLSYEFPALPAYPAGAVPSYTPGPVPGLLPAPGYGLGGYPAYGSPLFPYGATGTPGSYGGYLPPAAGFTTGPYPGRSFGPFGFW